MRYTFSHGASILLAGGCLAAVGIFACALIRNLVPPEGEDGKRKKWRLEEIMSSIERIQTFMEENKGDPDLMNQAANYRYGDNRTPLHYLLERSHHSPLPPPLSNF